MSTSLIRHCQQRARGFTYLSKQNYACTVKQSTIRKNARICTCFNSLCWWFLTTTRRLVSIMVATTFMLFAPTADVPTFTSVYAKALHTCHAVLCTVKILHNTKSQRQFC